MATKAKINEQGRIVIPAECREAAGMRPGTEVLVEVVGRGELRLRTKASAVRKAREIVAKHIGRRDLVSELIAERRREASRD
ncbi:MAG TPA: AbrB/MazE/SpoVT family DNA-binding domain-containing protein [Alphaproteobacteria bacterium]|nr:AbrB/MazE/SpoVT family DNA-binding domain-containing protein [Alphaproteobacteria bacterium]